MANHNLAAQQEEMLLDVRVAGDSKLYNDTGITIGWALLALLFFLGCAPALVWDRMVEGASGSK